MFKIGSNRTESGRSARCFKLILPVNVGVHPFFRGVQLHLPRRVSAPVACVAKDWRAIVVPAAFADVAARLNLPSFKPVEYSKKRFRS